MPEPIDYGGNAHRSRKTTPEGKELPPKEVKKVVEGEVKIQKRSLGRKVKDMFVAADFKTVVMHVGFEVLLPAAKNMIYDGAVTVVDRVMFGNDSRGPRRGYTPGGGITSRIAYHNPVNRGIREITSSRVAPPPPIGPRGRHFYDEVVLSSRQDAETVLDMMNEILDNYEIVTILDLNELCGRPSAPTDNNYGWVGLVGSQIRQVREGYLLELPAPEPIGQ